MIHPLIQLVKDQKSGKRKGITSICSANKLVLQAAMKNAKKYGEYVLIEATANQVNQFGGYTGMLPKDFADFAISIAKEQNFDLDKLILGGDHLGPLIWADKNETVAMRNAKELIKRYVQAGFTKIHIDTSMKLADDDTDIKLSDEIIARRGAMLCAAAEEAYNELKSKNTNAMAPVYVIGSEVPIPGGTQEEEEDGISITTVIDIKKTLEVFKVSYEEKGLSEAWQRVVAVVVQPGVEFGDSGIIEYDGDIASDLIKALDDYPFLIFEGHSTDYQTPEKLRQMVKDGIAILKVGPGLTFALREALFALADIEKTISTFISIKLSSFKAVLEEEMLKNPNNWANHYHGKDSELVFKRKFSFSDRCRYYLPNENVDKAISNMIQNLERVGIPLALLSQYMPIQYKKVRAGIIDNNPISLIHDRIINCLNEYAFGCGRKKR